VIPAEVSLELDGRLLPGLSPESFLAELRQLAGPDVDFAVTAYEPGPKAPDMGLFQTLARVLKEVDPQGHPAPCLLGAVTDARLFSRLGIQTYGFTPMQLPPDFNFNQAVHGADERIPVGAVEFGAEAIFRVIRDYQA
jgi:acetylornithine deacetylase/succinyl-diaminopimelate desuccinylase-like protein